MELGLAGRVFVVTGASSGLGLASAQALIAEGAKCVLVARNAEKLADACGAMGNDVALPLVADLAEPDAGDRAAALAVEEFGRLDGALISVGGPPKGRVLDITTDQWQTAFNQVFLGALRVARAVVAAAVPDVRLGFVLSGSVKNVLADMAPSNGLRPGLAMLVKQLADELGPTGGRAVGLMPGWIGTARVAWLQSQAPDPVAAKDAAIASIPLRRLGAPEEFGKVAAFALSGAASYLTGCMLPVDGGMLRSL